MPNTQNSLGHIVEYTLNLLILFTNIQQHLKVKKPRNLDTTVTGNFFGRFTIFFPQAFNLIKKKTFSSSSNNIGQEGRKACSEMFFIIE